MKTPRRVPCPMVGHLKHSFFGLSQPKSKCFTPPWGPEIFACGNDVATYTNTSLVAIRFTRGHPHLRGRAGPSPAAVPRISALSVWEAPMSMSG